MGGGEEWDRGGGGGFGCGVVCKSVYHGQILMSVWCAFEQLPVPARETGTNTSMLPSLSVMSYLQSVMIGCMQGISTILASLPCHSVRLLFHTNSCSCQDLDVKLRQYQKYLVLASGVSCYAICKLYGVAR